MPKTPKAKVSTKRSTPKRRVPRKLLSWLAGPEVGRDVLLAVDMGGKTTLDQLRAIAAGEIKQDRIDLRARAIFILSVFAWEPAADTIVRLARGKQTALRQQAILALPRFTEKLARAELLKLVRNAAVPEIETAQALEGLAMVGDEASARAILEWAAKAPTPTLRRIAEDAAARIELRTEGGDEETAETWNAILSM